MNILLGRKALLPVFLCVLVFLSACSALASQPPNPAPFDISLSDFRLTYEVEDNSVTALQSPSLRLKLTLEINNATDLTLKNVWFEFELNQEAQAFLAAHIIDYKSDPMDVTSKDKAIAAGQETRQIWGFLHSWSPLITSAAELKNYHQLSLNDISKHIQHISVTVHWDGGFQSAEFPLEFSDEDLMLIQSLTDS